MDNIRKTAQWVLPFEYGVETDEPGPEMKQLPDQR
jgi:hypothetical protein